MEISNKTLAWLVVAAIVVSIGGTLISINRLNDTSITGNYVSNVTGTASVGISTQTLLRFAVSSVDFGSGSVNATPPYQCNLSVNDTVGTITASSLCLNFPSTATGGAGTFQLENAGNTVMNVTLNFSKNATNFLGGGTSPNPTPIFQFQTLNNESSSCTTLNATTQNWTDVVENASTLVCTGLNWDNTKDSLLIGVKVGVPADATGSKSVTVTAQGTG